MAFKCHQFRHPATDLGQNKKLNKVIFFSQLRWIAGGVSDHSVPPGSTSKQPGFQVREGTCFFAGICTTVKICHMIWGP